MFVGAISQDIRAVLAGMATEWKGKPIYVGCSGNYAIERTLAKLGLGDLHSNDMSLYSCYIGSYLIGKPFNIQIAVSAYDWLEKYMQPGMDTIATLLLCSEMFKYAGRQERYHKRMLNAYEADFERLHAETVTKVQKALEYVKLSSFYPGDVLEFVSAAPRDAVVISFPPTYKGGYEKQYASLDTVFEWERPSYSVFDEESFSELVEEMTKKQHWVLMRDEEVPELESHLFGIVQAGMRKKPVRIYADNHGASIVLPRPKTQELLADRHDETHPIDSSSRLTLAKITQGQMNLLRNQYLSAGIIPSAATLNLVVLVDERVIGGLAFSRSNFPWCGAYMMTDFAVRPSQYSRLSKLVLAAALSEEARAIMEQALGTQIKTIGTTAFTERPVSMKYRGVFELHSRKEGRLNYIADAGRWPLGGGLEWWLKKHSRK